LIEPVEINKQGWLVAPSGIAIEMPMTKPIKSEKSIYRLEHLNEFRIGFE
jgi:xylan 1,4-beta-xylosidase